MWTWRVTRAWLRLFQLLVLLSGWILLGVSLSYLTSLATAERLEVTMARQAERMSQHLIIIGLGNVGFRISEALADLGLDMVVVDLAPPPAFYDSVARRAPVLAGDARQSDFLGRIAISEAEAVIACTSNDVANVEVCLHARRMNPKIRTVARVFDNKIVGTVASAFHIDRVLSATSIAESAFVIAASDEDALVHLPLGGEATTPIGTTRKSARLVSSWWRPATARARGLSRLISATGARWGSACWLFGRRRTTCRRL